MKLTGMDYMYIIVIILLIVSLIWVVLPFIYYTYNGNIDTTDCIADASSVRYDANESLYVYNCTYKNGNIIQRNYTYGHK